ncbi:hypothetical protein Tco_0095396, partial [Tanacetum coccineum]
SKKRRTRESDSTKKPSTTKESSKGKDPNVGSKTGKSAPAKDPVEQSTKDILISDEGHVSDPEDNDNAHIPKIPDTTTWFRPIPEEERPTSLEPEWVIPAIDLPEADNNWANAFAKLSKANLEDPAFMMVKGFHENSISLQFQIEECHKLLTNQIDLVNPEGHRIVPDISNPLPLGWYCRRIGKEELSKADLEGPTFMMVKGFHENSISLQFQMEECHKLLTNQIDLVNPKGHRIVPDISNPLPLGGPPGDKERNRALSISKLKAVLSLWIESERE